MGLFGNFAFRWPKTYPYRLLLSNVTRKHTFAYIDLLYQYILYLHSVTGFYFTYSKVDNPLTRLR